METVVRAPRAARDQRIAAGLAILPYRWETFSPSWNDSTGELARRQDCPGSFLTLSFGFRSG